MKMIINNKLEGSNELVGIKSSEKNTEIEALFAELFALVNLDSIDSEKTSLQEQSTKEIDTNVNLTESNKNTINIAKSLAEVFYKELGIDNKSIDKESKNKNNIINPENREISFKDLKNSKLTTDLKNIVSLNLNKKTPEFKNNPEMNKDLSEQKVFKTQNLEIKIKKIEKNNFENDIKKINIVDKPNKSPEINQLKNINTNTNENRVKSSKETNILLKEKKISKKKNEIIIGKNNDEQEIIQNKINKEIPTKLISNISRGNAKNSNDISLNLKNSNENKTNSKEKPLINNQNFNSKETLDLLESSWGEKFSKIIKNSIDRGISKLNFDLKPKNLGKISLEVIVKDSKTSIHINTENQEAANILNDNLPKLTDLIEEKNSKFSLLNDGSNNNHFNQQKKQTNEQETRILRKKDENELKKIKMNNYSIDVNA
ncbi:MAG: hypothetical protein CMP38_02200 [Rickettsiales bacterium]|nr:hypothetical protein [Rickettsiales bacterium]